MLKGTVSRDFLLLVFFMNQFPQAPDYTIRAVSIFFRKFVEIFAAQGLPPVSLTPVAKGKNLQSENFYDFFWTPYRYIFFFKSILSFQQFDNCSHCLPPASFTPVANLPPVLLIPVANCHWRCWHRWRICRRFHLVANLPPVSTMLAKWWTNLPPMLLIPVVHLGLRITPRI